MTALAAEDGKVLWQADHPASGYQSPEDMLVAGDLVWTGATTNVLTAACDMIVNATSVLPVPVGIITQPRP